jgi:molecular chaperone GrpE
MTERPSAHRAAASPPSGTDADDEPDAGAAGHDGPTDADDLDIDFDPDVELAEAADAVEADLAAIVAERDDYLAALRRVQADFENFRKQTIKRNTDLVERAAEGLVEKVLPALDAFDAALSHDDAKPHVRPIYDVLMDILEKEGLTVLYPAGELFDPQLHEAVLHEPAGDEQLEGPTVTEVLRAGYQWKGRVLRPALVRVKG